MSIDIEQRGGITHHETPNPALLNDEIINEVQDFLSYFAGVHASPLIIQHTYAYLKHHNNGRDVNPFKVGLWLKRNSPSELKTIAIPEEVIERGIYNDEKLRFVISELYSNLWKSNITTNLSDAYLAASIIEFEEYAYDDLEDLARVAYEHGHCLQTAWLILNNKTIPLDPKSQDVIDLCNNMHKHGELLSIPTNANPLLWGNSRRLPQLANLADENEEITNEVEQDEILSSINSKMEKLSIERLYKHANSVQSEIEKRVRLAAEAEAEVERKRLAAEAEKMEEERIRLAAEVKKMDLAYGRQVSEECLASIIDKVEESAAEAKAREERLAVKAKEKKEKEERERLAAEEEERMRLAVEAKEAEERERLAAEAKEHERLVVESTTDNDDPEFGDQDPFGDMEDNATLGGENSTDDDAISISSAEDEDELDEAEQLVEVDDEFESQLPQRFASAFSKFETTFSTDFKPDTITDAIEIEYQKNCKTKGEGGCSFIENGSRISKICKSIRHTGNLRKKKLVVGTGRTSPDSQRAVSAGRQQIGCFVVCFDMLKENDFFGDKEVELYSQLLFGFGDDRKRPENCLAFMELIKVVLSCDCDEIEVWFKSTLRVALEDEDFLYYVGTLMSLDSKKKVTIRCMENGLLTYEMLKEISQAKKVREDELKVINQDISHINASKNLSIVRDENYEWNVNHHQSVESKAQQYKSEWGPHGLPDDVIKDLNKLMISYHGSCLGRPHDQPYIFGEDGNNLPTRQQLQDFFSSIYRNSSIKELEFHRIDISDEFGGGLIEGLCGHPSLTRLQVSPNKIGSMACSALGKVLKHPTSKVKHLCLPYCHLDDDQGLSILCDSLLGNSRMKRMNLRSIKDITTAGWKALSTVLQHSDCKLVELDLNDTGIDDESANVLGSAFSGSSVSSLNLSNNKSISSEGWQIFTNHLSQAPIEKLSLYGNNNIDANGLAALASIDTLKSLNLSHTHLNEQTLAALTNLCGNMESLDLRGNHSITPTGWRSFFNSLQRRGVQLKKLEISVNKVGDVGVAALSSLLSNMYTLKTLGMSCMRSTCAEGNISSQGWLTFFNSLQDSNLDLAKLDLHGNTIDDEGLQLLVPLVSRRSSLRCLDLGSNQQATPSGWLAIMELLQSPTCVLKELHLDENKVNDDTVVAFASALEGNKTLKWLSLDYCTEEDDDDLITERGWDAFSALICNKTSIMSTYNSNHTLHGLGDLDIDDDDDDNGLKQMNLPDDLKSYLDLNKNKDKTEVVRQKILQAHFSDNDTTNMQELLDMELEIMPATISWIGRPTHDDWSGMNMSGLSTMYNLMRRLPDFFDTSAAKKKSATKRKSV